MSNAKRDRLAREFEESKGPFTNAANYFKKGWDARQAEVDELVKALEAFYAAYRLEASLRGWDGCVHDYEPNTTMDYMHCERCGMTGRTETAIGLYNVALAAHSEGE